MHRLPKVLMIFLCLLFIYSQAIAGGDAKTDIINYKGQKLIIGNESNNGSLRQETIILRSGEVFTHVKESSEYKLVKTLSRKDVHHIFNMIGRAAISSFNHPGDTSSFIEVYDHGHVTNYYSWGEEGIKVPDYVLADYTEILQIVR